jgi:Lanthionine-containing peptide SapB precursor RamS
MALLDIQGMDPVRDNGRWDDGSNLSVLACDDDY